MQTPNIGGGMLMSTLGFQDNGSNQSSVGHRGLRKPLASVSSPKNTQHRRRSLTPNGNQSKRKLSIPTTSMRSVRFSPSPAPRKRRVTSDDYMTSMAMTRYDEDKENGRRESINISPIRRNHESLSGCHAHDNDFNSFRVSTDTSYNMDTSYASFRINSGNLQHNASQGLKNNSNVRNPCSVTIFGFPMSARNFVYRKFAEYGRIQESKSDQNSVHVTYEDEQSALRSLQEDATWVNTNDMIPPFLIGVRYSEHIPPPMRSHNQTEQSIGRHLHLHESPLSVEKPIIHRDTSLLTKFVNFWLQGW